MADISYLFEEGTLVDFEIDELVRLVKALFADTALRTNIISKLPEGHPLQSSWGVRTTAHRTGINSDYSLHSFGDGYIWSLTIQLSIESIYYSGRWDISLLKLAIIW